MTKKGVRRGAFAAVISVGFNSLSAEAFVRTRAPSGARTRWADPSVVLSLSTAARLPGLSESDVRQALESAAAAWSGPSVACTAMKVSVAGGATLVEQVAQDGVNAVIFRRDRWCRSGDPSQGCYDSEMQAVTSVFLRNAPGQSDDGEILEADVEINAVNFHWANDGGETGRPGSSLHDLQSVLTHELGHVLGLAHTCDDGLVYPPLRDDHEKDLTRCLSSAPRSQATIMYPAERGLPHVRRVLATDETRAVCEIYPRRAGGCALAPFPSTSRTTVGVGSVLLIGLGLRRRRRPPG
jgi:hypothetical protein